MNSVLWVLQGLLAAVFAGSGLGKLFASEERLVANPQTAWIEDTGIQRARMAGAAEVAGAVGLIVPGITGTATLLIPTAALGLAVLMGLAAIQVHQPRDEPLTGTIVLGLLCLFVAAGRLVTSLG